MPQLFKMGIAVSCLHVVGLHEPPKNTWYLAADSIKEKKRNFLFYL